jgi:hypothetical protein
MGESNFEAFRSDWRFREPRVLAKVHLQQGCQMVYSKAESPNLRKFWRVLQCKYCNAIMYGPLVNFLASWYILWPIGTFFPFWHIEPRKIWQP